MSRSAISQDVDILSGANFRENRRPAPSAVKKDLTPNPSLPSKPHVERDAPQMF
jgi:hypothetical protein